MFFEFVFYFFVCFLVYIFFSVLVGVFGGFIGCCLYRFGVFIIGECLGLVSGGGRYLFLVIFYEEI